MKKIAFLVVDSQTLTPEETAAWTFLSGLRTVRATKLLIPSLCVHPRILQNFDLAWWHFDGSTRLPDIAIEAAVLDSIRLFLAKGRGLLLSLAATQFVVDLGIESVRPNVLRSGPWQEQSWAEHYPDIRGFGAFGRHPIFKGFSGGVFTSSPVPGKHCTAAYYQDQLPASGRVVSVEKLYIKLNEQRLNVIEYEFRGGRVLTIGSHFYFADRSQRFRKHLEAFSSNCFFYLSAPRARAPRAGETRRYWDFSSPHVTEVRHQGKPISIVSEKLPRTTTDDLAIHRDFSSPSLTEQFFDLSGRRILVMGGERGGITEVWCHPVRILENLKVRFKVGAGSPQWSHDLSPVITVRPESLTRRYEIENAMIEETLFADLTKPCGAIHYRSKSTASVQIILSARVDLRAMWPLSEHATGALRFSWDEGLHAGLITDAGGHSSSILGSSRQPNDRLIGHFSEVVLEHDELKGIPAETPVVALGMRLMLSPGRRQCTVAFAGSGLSVKESIQSYRSLIRNPGPSLKKQAARTREVCKHAVQLETPYEQLNKSYRWAIAGLDRLFVETPPLGRSFVAGYGLSSEGWNGGHSVSGRPGYAWYFGRDSVWTSFAALAAGEHEKVREVLEFLGNHQDVDGKILHELTTSGYAHYDAADATPLYLILMGRYVTASGDRTFAAGEFPRVLKAIAYCTSTDTDNDHLIENSNVGHGWVEGGQLFPAHAEHYLGSCWAEALVQAGLVAKLLRKNQLSRKWNRESKNVRMVLKRDFWNQETGFYNFSKQRDGSFNNERTVLPTVGMYFRCDEDKKSDGSLAACSGDSFSADWGVRIVGKESPLFKPTGYHYGSIWPLFTGWTALAEFTHRRPAQGYMHLLSNALLYDQFSAGNTEEVLHGGLFQPAGVCPHQAWSQAMVIQPFIEGMLGLETDGLRSEIRMSPYFPPNWHRAHVRNIRVGTQRLDFSMQRNREKTVYTFALHRESKTTGAAKRLHVSLRPFFPLGTRIERFTVGAREHRLGVVIKDYGKLPSIELNLGTRAEVTIEHSRGLALIPPVPSLVQGKESRGLRVLNESWSDKSYVLTLEGLAGEDYMLEIVDRSRTARTVEGARVMAHDGDHLILAVPFAGDDTQRSYVRKDIVVKT